MCGVLGFIGKHDVVSRLIKAAQVVENRGMQSTGLVVYNQDNKKFASCRRLGPASLVLDRIDLIEFRGNSGIAHTRYATSGASSYQGLIANIQPVFHDRPGMWSCSNGDIINLNSQREKLREQDGFSFQTDVDSKVIQNTLAKHMMKNKIHKIRENSSYFRALCKCINDMHSELKGAYSCATLMEKGLLIFRDPHGIRPLSIGYREEDGQVVEYTAFSESSVANYFGDYKGIRDVEPGEVIFIDGETLEVHSAITQQKQEANCFFEYVYFAMPDSKLKGRVVDEVRRELGQILAKEYLQKYPDIKERIDVVIGIPDTGIAPGLSFASVLNLPYRNAIIKRKSIKSNIRSFQETSQERREKVVKDKFLFMKEHIDGKRVLTVDDTNVRGTTAKKLNDELIKLGVKEIHNTYISPPIISPCFYGVDFPDPNELVAARLDSDTEKIANENHATTVYYISHEGLIEGIGLPENKLCRACITGKYPTDVTEAEERLMLRKQERAA